jgi:hypothetical protein
MKIIRDEGIFGNMFTTCLGIDWGIRRCNIEGCEETELGAIVTGIPNEPMFGVCENHYQMYFSNPMDVSLTLDFTPLWYIDPDDEYALEWRMYDNEAIELGCLLPLHKVSPEYYLRWFVGEDENGVCHYRRYPLRPEYERKDD